MGWSLNCLVVRGLTADEVAARLGCTVGDDRFSEDDAYSSIRTPSPSVATRDDGVVVVADPHFRLADDAYAELSSGAVTLHQVAVEEHSMVSAGACWSGGEQRWSVVHDAEQDLMSVEVTGAPPSTLSELLSRAQTATAQDGGVDEVFDVPVDLIARETGFRHDALAFADEEVFAPLVTIAQQPARRRGLFRRR